MSSDDVGKIPLALQQLTLAATRAAELGNTKLAASINKKVNELLEGLSIDGGG
jgi:hypothetical protein